MFDRAYLPVLLVTGYVCLRLARNLIYQPFIRPFTKRRKPQYRGRATRPRARDTARIETTATGT